MNGLTEMCALRKQ